LRQLRSCRADLHDVAKRYFWFHHNARRTLHERDIPFGKTRRGHGKLEVEIGVERRGHTRHEGLALEFWEKRRVFVMRTEVMIVEDA
jgi:hypothetical protein